MPSENLEELMYVIINLSFLYVCPQLTLHYFYRYTNMYYVAPGYFFLFMLLFVFILVNLFTVIIVGTYTHVQREKREEDKQILLQVRAALCRTVCFFFFWSLSS